MLTNYPVIGDFPLLRRFGDSPLVYNRLSCAGAPLRGHNGLDYATPIGTPVDAVQSGVVLATGDHPDGLGMFVLLGHRWGQSVYAHLSQILVTKGEQVGGGHLLGLSGDSGQCDVPHLHFGMRITPFTLSDGWCGYSDPQPYLDRLTTARGPLFGPHIINSIVPHVELLSRWQPRLITVLDPSPDEVRQLRQACPNSVIVGRVYTPDGEVAQRIRANPQDAAAWAHQRIKPHLTPDVNYWQFANEVCQSFEELPLLNAFETARMSIANENGYKCAIFAFSVGNPDLPEQDRMAAWELIYPAIAQAEARGHVIALHQYGMPDLWGPDNLFDWHIHRLEHQVLRRLPFKRVQFAVTEFGIDGFIRGTQPAGWQTFTTAENYAEQLARAARHLERYSGRVLGYSIFTLGHNSPWGSYDIAGPVANLLAERAARGTWHEIDTASTILPGDTEFSTDPGGDVIHTGEPTGPIDPGEPSEPTEPTEPVEPVEPTEPGAPLVVRRLGDLFEVHHMTIKTPQERPDRPTGGFVYLVKDVFTTRNGSWESDGTPGSVPEWARDAYLRPEFLEAGADHHLFAAILGIDGQLQKNVEIRYWSDGFQQLGNPDYSGYIAERTKESSGWANLFMAGGSSFNPDRGESGPWCWCPAGAAEVITGGGLPNNHHVSTFVVWQAVTWEAWVDATGGYDGATEPGDGGEEPGDGGTEPGDGGDEPDDGGTEPGDGGEEPGDGGEEPGDGGTQPPVPTIQRRLSDWVTPLRLSIKTISERPDNPQGDIFYVVKDIFTTRDGSWQPSDVMGAIPAWARAEYLKPIGAPDYFDDAGADHHLFAAVVGLDGKLVKLKDIIFWSDGFNHLGDSTYDGYVHRQTKDKSGWANIPLGPGSNYVPDRGESGPWCWAPTGAAEVVCGGGMPANHHISMFVVWQAVERGSPYGGMDYNIYLPVISSTTEPESDREPERAVEPLPQPLAATPAAPQTEVPQTEAPLPAVAASIESVRFAAWNRLGLEYDPASPLAAYARKNGLGRPITGEFRLDNYRAQGYAGGIVMVSLDNPADMTHVPW